MAGTTFKDVPSKIMVNRVDFQQPSISISGLIGRHGRSDVQAEDTRDVYRHPAIPLEALRRFGIRRSQKNESSQQVQIKGRPIDKEHEITISSSTRRS